MSDSFISARELGENIEMIRRWRGLTCLMQYRTWRTNPPREAIDGKEGSRTIKKIGGELVEIGDQAYSATCKRCWSLYQD